MGVARRPILLETEDGTTLPGEFVWTSDNEGHAHCDHCGAWIGEVCMYGRFPAVPRRSAPYHDTMIVTEPFVHAGREKR